MRAFPKLADLEVNACALAVNAGALVVDAGAETLFHSVHAITGSAIQPQNQADNHAGGG